MKIPFVQGDRNRETVKKIPLDDISTNPYQPRSIFVPEEIDELALSIKNYGVIQPIIVREKDKAMNWLLEKGVTGPAWP